MIEWTTVRYTTDGFCEGRLTGRVVEIDHFSELVHFDALDARNKPFIRIGSFKTLMFAQEAIEEYVNRKLEELG